MGLCINSTIYENYLSIANKIEDVHAWRPAIPLLKKFYIYEEKKHSRMFIEWCE